MANRDSAIGVFDSGIGGLTVLHKIIEALPRENTVYLGDTARAPYGTKSVETVLRYSFEDSEFLVEKGVKLLVVACNTSTAIALGPVRERLAIPVIGVIEPGVRRAIKTSRSKKSRGHRYGRHNPERCLHQGFENGRRHSRGL
jgi:glutamate racemase